MMGPSKAAAFQFFQVPEYARAKVVLRSTFMVLGIGLGVAVHLKDPAVVYAGAGLAVMSAVILFVRSLVIRKSHPAAAVFWQTNAFSFLLMGLLLLPGGLFMLESMAAMTLVAAVSGLSLLAGVVGFCLGRFAYVMLFIRAPAEHGGSSPG